MTPSIFSFQMCCCIFGVGFSFSVVFVVILLCFFDIHVSSLFYVRIKSDQEANSIFIGGKFGEYHNLISTGIYGGETG